MSEKKYTVLIDHGAGTGRIVNMEEDFERRWGENFIDIIENNGEYDVPRYTKKEAQRILDWYFPVRYVVTYNAGEGKHYIHRVTQGNWKGSMFGHENYCADFSTREDAQEYIFWVERRVASPKAFPFGIEGEDGREYFEISSCCSLCEEKGEVQEGHFACRLEKIPEGFREETDAIRTSSGWKKLISCPVATVKKGRM